MSVRCKDPSRHSKWGEWADDGQVGWCRICSPGDEPTTDAAQDAPRAPVAGRDASLPADTGDDRPEAWARLYGKVRR